MSYQFVFSVIENPRHVAASSRMLSLLPLKLFAFANAYCVAARSKNHNNVHVMKISTLYHYQLRGIKLDGCIIRARSLLYILEIYNLVEDMRLCATYLSQPVSQSGRRDIIG